MKPSLIRVSCFCWCLVYLLAAPAMADSPAEVQPNAPRAASSESSAADQPAELKLVSGEGPASAGNGQTPANPTAKQLPSDAERIARLERSIEADQNRLRELRTNLNSPDGEYAQAEQAFKDLDSQRNDVRKRLAAAQEAGKADEVTQLQAELDSLEKKWALAKERFDLAISERKAGQENATTLEHKLQSDRETLEKLAGVTEPEKLAPAAAAPAPQAATAPAETPPAATPVPAPAVPAASPPEPVATAPVATLPTMAPLATAPTSAPASIAAPSAAVSKKRAEELEAASKAAEESRLAAAAAEAEARTIAERIAILNKDIEQQRVLRETARKKVENADQTLKGLNEELFRKLMAGEKIDGLKQQIEETTSRLLDSRDRSREINTHLDQLQSTLVLLQEDQLNASKEALRKRENADHDQQALAELENPFALRNVLQWLSDHGPRILAILLSLVALLWLSRVMEARLVGLIARRGRRGSREDRENRAKTLVGVFNNVANLLIIGGGVITVLGEIGILITPVIGGAAVLGLAVAFGAESDQGLLHRIHGPLRTAVPDQRRHQDWRHHRTGGAHFAPHDRLARSRRPRALHSAWADRNRYQPDTRMVAGRVRNRSRLQRKRGPGDRRAHEFGFRTAE